MSMRFFIPVEAWPSAAGEVLLEGAEAHHASSVMRMAVGKAVELFDGRGRTAVGQVVESGKRSLRLSIAHQYDHPRPVGRLALAVAVPKKSNIEWIIEKAVELGVSDVMPLLTQRTVVRLDDSDRPGRQKKWERSAIEAAKQCGQNWLPLIHPPQAVEEALQCLPPESFSFSMVACLQPDALPLRQAILAAGLLSSDASSGSGAVWIGPEGDFTEDEYTLLRNAGLLAVSLGPLVLRVETAALYTLSVLRLCFSQ